MLIDLLLGLEPAAESSCHPLLLCQPYSYGSHQILALTEGNSISCDGQTETEGQLKSLFSSS